MTLSSFVQPLPSELETQLATGYELTGDDLTPAFFQYDRAVPAGSLSATTMDMAALMILSCPCESSVIVTIGRAVW